MRTLFIIIVIGALAYLGWVFRDELAGNLEAVTGSRSTPVPTETAPETPMPETGEPAAAPVAIAPAPKEMAPAGSFYVKERVSLESGTGIKALNAGELVKLKYRNKDGTARVTDGKVDLTIKEALLTADPAEIKK